MLVTTEKTCPLTRQMDEHLKINWVPKVCEWTTQQDVQDFRDNRKAKPTSTTSRRIKMQEPICRHYCKASRRHHHACPIFWDRGERGAVSPKRHGRVPLQRKHLFGGVDMSSGSCVLLLKSWSFRVSVNISCGRCEMMSRKCGCLITFRVCIVLQVMS